MWPWTPTSSAPSFQPAAYPHMQHIPTAHPPFPTSRLATPQTVFPSTQQSYYSSLANPNVGYSGGLQLGTPQTLPMATNWGVGQVRSHAVPEENITYIQQQHEAVMRSPGTIAQSTPRHHIQESPLQNSYAPQEDSYQTGIFTHPSGQALYQVSPGSQQSAHIGSFQASTPSQMPVFHQQLHPLSSANAHTPAFHSQPQGHPTTFQAASPHHFPPRLSNIDKPPTSSSPFQPLHNIITGGQIEALPRRASIDQCPPELSARRLEQRPPELRALETQSGTTLMHESRDGLGYPVSTGHAQSNPFSMDFLLRDRPSNLPVDGEFTSEPQQQQGYPGYQPRQSTSEPLLPFDSQTEEDEKPFSPPELVPIEMTLDKDETLQQSNDQSHDTKDQSHEAHEEAEACRLASKGSSRSSTGNDNNICEGKSTPFQLAESVFKSEDHSQVSSLPTEQPKYEVNKESNQSKNDKYISPLIRHQRNRGYESSDDDDVFLPDPELRKSMLSTNTKEEAVKEEQKPRLAEESVPIPAVPPLIASPVSKPPAVVIKRGRGTAKTLDLQKLQMPLSQGWRRLIRKRVGTDQIRVDICYIAPEGRRLRTFPEIQGHLNTLPSTELTVNHFTFSKKVNLGEVLDGIIGEGSTRGRRGRGRGKAAKVENPTNTDGTSPTTTSPPSGRGRGRGRGGRGRGGRQRKTAESAVRGEQSQLAMYSARAPVTNNQQVSEVRGPLFFASAHGPLDESVHAPTVDPNAQGQILDGSAKGIGAVSQATAVALIQKALKETDLEKTSADPISREERTGGAILAHGGENGATPPQQQTDEPTPLVTQPSIILGENTSQIDPNTQQTSREDGLAVLSSSAISTQVFSNPQPQTSYEFHMHTPSSISTSLQGVGRGSGKGRGRKRKSLARSSVSDMPQKRPRGRPKGSGPKLKPVEGEVKKKRRGRKPKTLLPNTSDSMLPPLAPRDDVTVTMAGVAAPPSLEDGGAGISVIMSVREGEDSTNQTAKVQEEKRRQLLLKARADKARKKEARNFQRSLAVSQRRVAQRQRRDREKQYWKDAKAREKDVMKETMGKQEKLSKQRELEDREMQRQSAYRQREVDNQRKARERTVRLLDHLKQQEMERHRRAFQQQLEMEKMAQLKRPVEDLEVRQTSSLPSLPSLGWVQLPSKAFADLLMVLEFGQSFTELLELESAPSLSHVYLALYNHDQGRVLLELTVQLLKAALYDPGTRAVTLSGHQLDNVEVTPLTVSELLRLFLSHQSSLGPITAILESSPLQFLRPSEKVQILSHLVGQLLDSASLTREVDTRMEQLASLRRDKWKISLKMKRFRSRLSSVYGVGDKHRPIPYSGRGRPPKRALMGVPGEAGESSDEGEEAEDEGGAIASEGEYSEELTDEETPESKEELQARLKSLSKKFVLVRQRIHSQSRRMRQFPLGQDRYARQYWALPSLGGVIVEGVETSLDQNLQVLDTVVSQRVNQSNESIIANKDEPLEVNIVNIDNEVPKTDATNDMNQQEAMEIETNQKVKVQVTAKVKVNPNPEEINVIANHEPELVTQQPHQEAQPTHHNDVKLPMAQHNGETVSQKVRVHTEYDAMEMQPQKESRDEQKENGKNCNFIPMDHTHKQSTGNAMETNNTHRTESPLSGSVPLSRRSESPQQPAPALKLSVEQAEHRLENVDPSPHVITEKSKEHSPTPEQSPKRTPQNIDDVIPHEVEETAPLGAEHVASTSLQSSSQAPQNVEISSQCIEAVPKRGEESVHPHQCVDEATPQRCEELAPREPLAPQCIEATPQRCEELAPRESLAPQCIEATPQRCEEAVPSDHLACSELLTGEESKDGMDEPVPQQAPQRWFSFAPRQPCEVSQLAYLANQASIAQQQFMIAGPSPQYAYMTPDGQIIAAPGAGMVQQVGISYGIVGNTLVQMPTPQPQYIAVDSTTGAVIGQQGGGAGVQYVVTGGDGGRYVAMEGSAGYITAAGGGGQVLAQPEGGNQMIVVQDQNGQQTLVSLSGQNAVTEVAGRPSPSVEMNITGEAPGHTSLEMDVVEVKREVVIKKEETQIDMPSSSRVSDMRVENGEELQGEGVRTVTSEELAPEEDREETAEQSQYVTAVVPGGPDGAPQYVSLPADPRVLNGQCSYAVLQQPDGSQQIVLIDNNTINSGSSQSGGDGSSVITLEIPPPSMMENEAEGEEFVTPITLMYAQQPLPFMGGTSRVEESKEEEKDLRDLLEEQDIELTHGWWGITRPDTVDRLLRTLCTRGVREKFLSKHLQKNKDNINAILNPKLLSSFETSVRDHFRIKSITESAGESSSLLCEETQQESSTEEVKMETDEITDSVGVMMETDESTDSVGVKSKIEASRSTNGTNSVVVESKIGANRSTNKNGEMLSHDTNDPQFPAYCLEVLLSVVEYLEGMQSRLITAQLHNEGVELWDSLRSKVSALGHTPQSMTLVSESVLELERSIDRAHLKPPLRDKKLYMEEQERVKDLKSRLKKDRPSLAIRRDSTQLELPSDKLLSWRKAVGVVSSASQLAVCMSELEMCIAWEKSNTIVFCQVCHGGENESLLLLCDRCDKGTHTYCCKPKLSIVPEGDWYCYNCITSNSKYRPCYTCDSKRGVLLSCAVCPKNYHKRCLNPPLNKHPPYPWKCSNCKNKPIPQSRQKDGNYLTRKRDKVTKSNNEICHTLLKDLESHDSSWPFLEAVERRKFPAYYKVVKQPMDLQTMKNKLEQRKYEEDKELFAADARLIFSNCAYYNEDDSEIGLAGHNMSEFFEEQWSKLSHT